MYTCTPRVPWLSVLTGAVAACGRSDSYAYRVPGWSHGSTPGTGTPVMVALGGYPGTGPQARAWIPGYPGTCTLYVHTGCMPQVGIPGNS
eukprot:1172528-Rhodomonas_salina.1